MGEATGPPGPKNKKQRAWLAFYLRCFNATEAARRAGYKWPQKQGPRLLGELKGAITEAIEQQAMGATEVLQRLGQQARAEYAEFINVQGQLDLEGLLAAGLGHLIKGISPTRYGNRVEFYDGQAALALIGKYHALFTDRQDITSQGQALPQVVIQLPDNNRDHDQPSN